VEALHRQSSAGEAGRDDEKEQKVVKHSALRIGKRQLLLVSPSGGQNSRGGGSGETDDPTPSSAAARGAARASALASGVKKGPEIRATLLPLTLQPLALQLQRLDRIPGSGH